MSLIERFKDATIGFSGYPRLARDRVGGFGYMAVLLLVVLAIACVIQSVQVNRGLTVAASALAAAPDFALDKGEVQFSGPMPYVYKEENNVFIVDTTGQTTSDALKGYPAGMLITKNKVYQTQVLGGIKETDLSQIPLTLTKADLVSALGSLWIVVPVFYVFVYGFQLGFKALDACILGVVALLWGSANRRRVPFELGFKLGLYAMTMPIIIQWIVPGYTTIPFVTSFGTAGMVLWWALAVIYLVFGLKAYYKSQDDAGQTFYTGNP